MQLVLTHDSTTGATLLHDRLTAELNAGKNVLWFLTGGSTIAIETTIMAQLDPAHTSRLTLALTDERYGNIGHKDSNWQQLDEVGFNPQNATVIRTLISDELSMEDTSEAYARALEAALEHCDIALGIYGMGPDGHIAGILPESPASEADGLVTCYQTETFARITTTFSVIQRCSAAYVFAIGEAKKAALENLRKQLPLEQQPAQIIKQLPEAFVFNDQIGD